MFFKKRCIKMVQMLRRSLTLINVVRAVRINHHLEDFVIPDQFINQQLSILEVDIIIAGDACQEFAGPSSVYSRHRR